jgi:hypothetical protein
MAEQIIRGCMPYFIAKQEQAQMALLFRSTFVRAGYLSDPQQLEDRSKFAKELSRLKHELPDEGRVVIQ